MSDEDELDVEDQEPEAERADRKSAVEPELERVIEKISSEHAFDVRGYRRSSLYRRLCKRMADAGCGSVEDYLVRLESDGQEYPLLLDTLLINVTRFFRDPEAWDYLQKDCLAPLQQRRAAGPGEGVRVWSAGCATGEEAYTLAICLAEVLGEDDLREVKIYATDVDDSALSAARTGLYPSAAVQHLSRERLARFFEELPRGGYRIRRELRAAVIFGRHNVLQDPPISRLDVLCCRNLLIYFDTATQQQLLSRFHYALRHDGFLFLGKAETLMTRSSLFHAVEPRFRIFQRNSPGAARQPSTSAAEPGRPPRSLREPNHLAQSFMVQAFLNAAPDPLILLDPTGRIAMASPRAREIFQITGMLLGRNFLELEERFRPVPLRLAIEEARTTGRGVRLDDIQVLAADGTMFHLVVDVQPVMDPFGALARIVVWGHDVSRERQLAAELGQVRQELETANEELQCTNEELETTIEELQSTNEELETTNEELQSTNEELEATNDELRARQEELNGLTDYQEMVLSSLHVGLIAIDRNLVITSWNRKSEDTWGLRENEAVGQDLFSLDTGLPVKSLREPLQNVIHSKSPSEIAGLDATNRRGRPVRCRVRINPLLDPKGEAAGATILIEEAPDAVADCGGG